MNPPPVPFGDPSKVEQENKDAVKKGVLFGCGGCAVVIFAGVVLVAAIVVLILTGMSSSDVCTQAVARAQSSARVRAVLGQPVDKGWWVTGSINTSNSTGDADVTIPISGPQGEATIHAKATKANGVWTFSILTVTLPDGKVVDLLGIDTALLKPGEQLLMHTIEAAIAKHDDHIAAASA